MRAFLLSTVFALSATAAVAADVTVSEFKLDDLPLGHDDDPVADVADHVHVVLDEEHRHALLAQVLDVLQQ